MTELDMETAKKAIKAIADNTDQDLQTRVDALDELRDYLDVLKEPLEDQIATDEEDEWDEAEDDGYDDDSDLDEDEEEGCEYCGSIYCDGECQDEED